MRSRLIYEARRYGGFLTGEQARQIGGKHLMADAVAAGVFVRLFPGIYVLAALVNEPLVRDLAALTYLVKAAVSHTSALRHYPLEGLRLPKPGRLHLTVPGEHPKVTHPDLVVHRRRNFTMDRRSVRIEAGLRVVPLAQAIVESWLMLPAVDRRAPTVIAIRQRCVTPADLYAAIEANPRLPGRADLRRLVELVAGGCHSELELWGHERVFADPRLPSAVRQYRLPLGDRAVYLDRYYEEEMVDVELDGAAHHGSKEQRERDLARDAQVSTTGILPVRFSHDRLFGAPAACREELIATLAVRRRQFGLPPL